VTRLLTRSFRGRVRLAALAALPALLLALPGAAATDFTKYHTHAELTAALKALASANPTLVKLVDIGKSREGRSVWALELASQTGTPVDRRPGLLIAANLEGDQVVGSALALAVAESLAGRYATDADVKQRLDQFVVYVLPRVNPDGAEQMFAAVKAVRRTNMQPFDDDNDGRVDEDGPEDLNKDGFITVMRVKDPKGPYMISPDDKRLMRRADPARGEAGGWSVYWEGIDNDGDGFINEDGPGGADLNRNFQHQYPYFEPDAGHHMTSEPETRAVLDFVLKHRNIAMMLTFGQSDNLITSPGRRGEAGTPSFVSLFDFADRSVADARKVGMIADMAGGGFGGRGGGMFIMTEGGPGPGGGRGTTQSAPSGRAAAPARRPATTVNTADVDYFRTIGEKYRELTGIRSAPVVRAPAGAFFEYGYYQFGVPSFSTPGWGLPGAARGGAPGPGGTGGGEAPRPAAAVGGFPPQAPAGIPASAIAAMAGQRGGAGRGAGAGAAAGETESASAGDPLDLRLLQWIDAEKIDGFVNWTPSPHPALGTVEIGGFKPHATVNPPPAKIADLAAGHAKFVVYLTSLFPRVRIASTEVVSHGAGLYRVKASIENSGYLPTALAQGVQARAVKPTMVQLEVEPTDIIAGSEKTSFIQALAGSGSRQSYEWIIRGKPGTTITLKAVSDKAGFDTATLKLQ